MGGDRAFTFDHAFDENTSQYELYSKCVQDLVDGVFRGYNATILAVSEPNVRY